MLRFLILFCVLLTTLFGLQILNWSQENVIGPFTMAIAHVCVWLVELFDDDVVTYGKVIASTIEPFAISIEPGCNGVEALIILFSAIVAFPAPWKHKLIGLGLGFFAIQGLNLVRIISLFYLGLWSATAFKWFHLYLWQALIILDALVFWLVWLKYLPKDSLPRNRDDDPPDGLSDNTDLEPEPA